MNLFFTCEHASCALPEAWRKWAKPIGQVQSHLGWDPGAEPLFRVLCDQMGSDGLAGTHSRILCDLNRSAHHPRVLGRGFQKADPAVREACLAELHAPWRDSALACMRPLQQRGTLVHISVHSFTPVLQGKTRECDIGILYDSARPWEVRFAETWVQELSRSAPHLRIRRNYPYRGNSDGHCTALRSRWHGAQQYLGIELELNQELLCQNATSDAPRPLQTLATRLGRILADSLWQVDRLLV